MLLDTDRQAPELVELLADINPLTRFPGAGRAYARVARLRGTIPTLEQAEREGP